MSIDDTKFRIKLSIVIFKENKLTYKNELVVPTYYSRRSEARAHIKKEIRERLSHSSFFISPRVDYDLVRYTQEASCNTYLRYRIIDCNSIEKIKDKFVSSSNTKKPVLENKENKSE